MKCKSLSHIRIGNRFSFLQCVVMSWMLCWLPASSWASCPDMVKIFTDALGNRGYSAQSFEEVRSIMDSPQMYDRWIAIQLLGLRFPQQSLPVFKTGLSDPYITVRTIAAHYLGAQGDMSGLDQMRKDFERLLKSERKPADPKQPSSKAYLGDNLNGQQLSWSLDVANVLAELGDNQGFDLAKECLLKSPLAACRSQAVKVLAQINLNQDKLKVSDSNDPIPIICQAVEKEDNWLVYTDILQEAKRLKPEIYQRVLQHGLKNTKQKDREIRITKSRLSALEKELKKPQ